MKWISGKPIYLVAIGVFLLLFVALLITNANVRQQQAALESYTTEPEETEPLIAEPDVELDLYTALTLPYTIEVPQGWIQAEEDGCVTFFNSLDGAKIQLIEMEYFGGVNNVTLESITDDLAQIDGQLLYFDAYNNKYYAKYYLDGLIYLEETIWDRLNVLRISCVYTVDNDTYYDQLFSHIIDSLNWEWQDPIPVDCYLFYSDYGNFETGLPVTWSTYIDNKGRLVATSEYNSVMTCAVSETDADFSLVTQDNFFSSITLETSEYEIIYYENTGRIITGEITYIADDGQQYCVISNYLKTDSFLYSFSLMCLAGAYEEDASSYMNAVSLFRVFE